MLSRRQFLKFGIAAGAVMAFPLDWSSLALAQSSSFVHSPSLRKFAQPLRGVGQGGIPVAAPDTIQQPWWQPKVSHYTIGLGGFMDLLHPDLGPTSLRGFQPTTFLGPAGQPQHHLGGIVVAQRDKPVQITFRNNFAGPHPIPIDRTLMGAMLGDNRADVHLHGGFVPWISDGGPHAWWDPKGKTGPSFINNKVLNPKAGKNEAEYYYPNQQSARLMWYHDHVFGTTRVNAYAGIATAYVIRDKYEGSLRNLGLPDYVENGGREIPIVIQDKIFVGPDIATQDPTWTGPSDPGSLWYPHIYDPNRWELEDGGLPLPNPSVIPEMFGDTMLANGTVYPEVTVEARRYRLRILNACQARFLNLQLYVDDGSPDGITLKSGGFTPANRPGPDWLVLGTEGGFLAHPTVVSSHNPFTYNQEIENMGAVEGRLLAAPAERWDVIVDFSGFGSKKVILYNDAPAPFPMGDPLTDFFPGAPENPVQPNPGFGPNTRQIMRFNVLAPSVPDPKFGITTGTTLPGTDPSLVGMWTTTPLPPPPGVKVRQLTLNEDFDEYGRLIQMLGTNAPGGAPGSGSNILTYDARPTETMKAGDKEVWEIINLTGDTHPMHFHLCNVQLLSRRPFDNSEPELYDGTPAYSLPPRGPEATELGWKETVKCHPGEVTTVIMQFTLPALPFTVPPSPRLQSQYQIKGAEYVWHCHILEHEEHDMMRPLVVL